MNSEDVIYAIILFISLSCGHFIITNIHSPNNRQLIIGSIGLCLSIATCGWHVSHSLLTVFSNYFIILLLGPRYSHIASFIWTFSYLAVFRGYSYLGLPKPPPYANGIQLILTLKVVGAAFEIHDTHKTRQKLQHKFQSEENEEEVSELKRELQYRGVDIKLLDFFSYSYCYVGLLTGPYYKFRTYLDLINTKRETVSKLPRLRLSYDRIVLVPVYTLLYLGLSHYYYIEYSASEEFFEHHFMYRLWYMVPMFMVFRLRVYIAWLLSECCCMMLGLGAYPTCSKPKPGAGPTNLKALDEVREADDYDFECIHNINERGCEFSSTVREGMRSWNMTVQYWMAHVCYRRIKMKSIRTSLTMLVSAYWHGLHGGYYLSFLTVPLCLAAEDGMKSVFRHERNEKMYDLVAAFVKMRAFDYMAMAFLLLEASETLAYWGSIYYIMHVVALVCLVMARVMGRQTIIV